MYPDFRYLIQGLFGVEAPAWLSLLKMFGFMVAVGFIAATWVITSELRRKERQGLLQPTYEELTTGGAVTATDLFWAALVGFLLGYKVGGIFTGDLSRISANPMGYFVSAQGNLLAGIIGAVIIAGFRYYEKKKAQLPQPKTERIAVWPHQRISEIVMIGALGGLAGAKLFNAFETWDDFVADPIGNLVNSSGLTFYGGLIVATIIFYYFARKHKIRFVHLCDAAAPAILLAYGIGRLGCQFSGDGDWGIYNSAYVTNAAGDLQRVPAGSFDPTVQQYSDYFLRGERFQAGHVPHAYVPTPGWLPQAFIAQNYKHNVNNTGILLPGCRGEHCGVLPVGVFPTSLYESIVCIGLFFFLWGIRKRIRRPFHLFGIYLILNGLERFFVEQIRVNYKYDWGFLHPTQAEIIAVCLALAGLGIVLFYKDAEKVAVPENRAVV